MFPFGILRVWILGLLSLAVLGTAACLLWEWYDEGEREYLYWGLGLLACGLLGRFIVMPLLGGLRGLSGPLMRRDGRGQRLRRSDGTELYIETHGPEYAPSLVLVHGWSLDSRVWRYAEQELAGRFRLITWDLPGAGLSSGPRGGDYSLTGMADDLKAVLDLTGPRPVCLLGHSIGGMVLQEFCRLHPAELGAGVKGLVLVDTTYTNPLRTTVLRRLATAFQKPLIEPLLHLTVWASPLVWLMNLSSYQNGTMHLSTRRTSFAGRQTWGQLDFACRLSLAQSPAAVARGTLAMLRFDAQDVLPHITVPTLVVHGANDRPVRPDAGEHLARTIPGARLEVLDPAGHLGLLERHEEFGEVVGEFVDRCHGQPAADAAESAGAAAHRPATGAPT